MTCTTTRPGALAAPRKNRRTGRKGHRQVFNSSSLPSGMPRPERRGRAPSASAQERSAASDAYRFGGTHRRGVSRNHGFGRDGASPSSQGLRVKDARVVRDSRKSCDATGNPFRNRRQASARRKGRWSKRNGAPVTSVKGHDPEHPGAPASKPQRPSGPRGHRPSLRAREGGST